MNAIKRNWTPLALTMASDLEMSLLNMVEHSCMSTAAIARNRYTPRHKDPEDVCKGGLMLGVAWFQEDMCPNVTLSLA